MNGPTGPCEVGGGGRVSTDKLTDDWGGPAGSLNKGCAIELGGASSVVVTVCNKGSTEMGGV